MSIDHITTPDFADALAEALEVLAADRACYTTFPGMMRETHEEDKGPLDDPDGDLGDPGIALDASDAMLKEQEIIDKVPLPRDATKGKTP